MASLPSLWYRKSPWHALLLPVAWLFGALTALRRALFRHGLLRVERLPVPVIVVGNITVGGSGKTPLVIHLVQLLSARGFKAGVVSRGHGGSEPGPSEVVAGDDPARVGDEPVLIRRRASSPMFIGRDRPAAARALLAAHPDTNVIVSDDGLQHYALGRDVEIVVIDGARGLGNGWLLPAGPLREPASRAGRADCVVVNGVAATSLPEFARRTQMRLEGALFCNLADPSRRAAAGKFSGQRVHALAGIGNPARFFAALRALGIEPIEHWFADHHRYRASDLEFGDDAPVLMTEKDAVKCAAFAAARFWMLPVSARLPAEFDQFIIERLRRGPQAA